MYLFGKIPQTNPVSSANPSGNHEIQGAARGRVDKEEPRGGDENVQMPVMDGREAVVDKEEPRGGDENDCFIQFLTFISICR